MKKRKLVIRAGKIAGMEVQLHEESQRACEDVGYQLHTQGMEFTMFQNQGKSKLQALSSHKKVLQKGSHRVAQKRRGS